MHPLTIQEVGYENFNLEHAIKFGLLPDAVVEDEPKKYLQSYVQTYIKEEVLQEGLTRNIGSFNRFLETATYLQGSLLNISEISRELGINRSVVSNYFDILEDLLIAKKIEPFLHRAKRKIVSHQKFYFFDSGVYRTIKPSGPLDISSGTDGAVLETIFFQSLNVINDKLGTRL